MIEIPPPPDAFISAEEHPCGHYTIRIEFYKALNGRYFVWPYIRQQRGDGDTMKHFMLVGHFENMDAARDAALQRGRELIDNGVDIYQPDPLPAALGTDIGC